MRIAFTKAEENMNAEQPIGTAKPRRWRVPVWQLAIPIFVLATICVLRACARFVPNECVASYSPENGSTRYYKIISYDGKRYGVKALVASGEPVMWFRIDDIEYFPASSFTWKHKRMKCPEFYVRRW
jgi:hypothetical protein